MKKFINTDFAIWLFVIIPAIPTYIALVKSIDMDWINENFWTFTILYAITILGLVAYFSLRLKIRLQHKYTNEALIDLIDSQELHDRKVAERIIALYQHFNLTYKEPFYSDTEKLLINRLNQIREREISAQQKTIQS